MLTQEDLIEYERLDSSIRSRTNAILNLRRLQPADEIGVDSVNKVVIVIYGEISIGKYIHGIIRIPFAHYEVPYEELPELIKQACKEEAQARKQAEALVEKQLTAQAIQRDLDLLAALKARYEA